MIIPPLAANAGFGGLGGDELGADQEGAIQQSSGWLSRREWPHTGLAGRCWNIPASLPPIPQNIPNAQLIIYPDAGHGTLFQVPKLFVAHAEMFLDA